jgi:phosphohistidine phosphatase
MAIYLIRHADAVPEQMPLVDENRYLTAGGRDAARDAGRRLGVVLDALYTSPLVRAVQTAELVAASSGFAGTIEVDLDLAPGGDLRALAARLQAHEGDVAVVGHEPGISALAGILTGRPRFPPLNKAEIVKV